MSLDRFRSVDIRIDKADHYFMSSQFAKGGDYNGRTLVVQITNGGLIETQAGITVNFGWRHESVNNSGLDPFEVVDAAQGIFEISYPREMLNPGRVTAVIQIIDGEIITETKNFVVQVEKSPIDETTIVSSNSFTILQEALIKVNDWNARIDAVEADFIQRANDMEAIYPQQLVSLTTQLTETDSRIDVIIAESGNGTIPSELSDIRVASDGKVYTVASGRIGAIEDGSGVMNVPFTKIDKSAIIGLENLADYENRASGNYIKDDGTIGSTIPEVYYLPKIEIKPSSQYTFAKILDESGVWLDENNTLVSVLLTGASSVPITLTSPPNAKYLYWNGDQSITLQNCIVVEGNVFPSEYVPFGGKRKFNNLIVEDDNITSVSIKKVVERTSGGLVNLADYDSRTTMKYISDSGTELPTGNTDVYHLPKMEISPSSQYNFPCILSESGVWMDENDAVISVLRATEIFSPITLTSPPNAKYLYWNGDYHVPKELCVITEEGRNYFSIVDLEIAENNLSVPLRAKIDSISSYVVSKWANKNWTVIGDSITEHNFRTTLNYHDYIKQVVPMNITNRGVSGTGFYSRYNAHNEVTEQVDLLTLFFGTNDWGNVNNNNLPLGNFGDTTTATVAGCIDTMFRQLINKFYNKTIAVFTPLPRSNSYGSMATPNTQGYTLEQLANMIVAYCKHYSIPYLDLYHESNLPVYNASGNTYYFTAPGYGEPDGLHPNDNGHMVMADKILAFLNTL